MVTSTRKTKKEDKQNNNTPQIEPIIKKSIYNEDIIDFVETYFYRMKHKNMVSLIFKIFSESVDLSNIDIEDIGLKEKIFIKDNKGILKEVYFDNKKKYFFKEEYIEEFKIKYIEKVKQIFGSIENEVFIKYNFFWIKSEQSNKYYYINKKGKKNYHNFSINSLLDYIIYDNKNVFEKLDIPEVNDKGNPIPSTERKKILFNYLNQYLIENTIIIEDVKYKPGESFFYSEKDENYINSYIPPIIKENNHKDYSSIKEVMKNITVTEEGYNFFCKWLAYILQNPTVKLPTSFIFMGTQGTGKNLFFDTVISKLFGKRNTITIEQSTIESGWDDFFFQKQIVACDEIHVKRRDIVEKLKSMTTNPEYSYKIKHRNIVEGRNYSHWLFFTNRNIPFLIEENDRRYTIFEQIRPIKQEKIDNLLENVDKEIYPFFKYLLNLKVEKSEVIKPMMTEEKKMIIENSLPIVKKFIQDIRNYENIGHFISDYMIFEIELCDDKYINSSNFFKLFREWCVSNNCKVLTKTNFSRDLNKYYEIETKPKKINNISMRVIALEDIMKNNEVE